MANPVGRSNNNAGPCLRNTQLWTDRLADSAQLAAAFQQADKIAKIGILRHRDKPLDPYRP